MQNDGLPDKLIAVVVAFVILLVGVTLLSSVAAVSIQTSDSQDGERV